MKNFVPKNKKTKRVFYILLPFVLPLCLIILGILMLVNETFIDKLFLGIGILLALIGLVEIVVYASRHKYEVQTQFLITGIILMVVGTLLMIIPFTINTLIPVLIGICVLASGFSGAVNTMTFRQENSNVLIPILFAVTNMLLGIFILIYVLFVNQNAGWNIIGILMIISGALRIINEVLARIAVPKTSGVVETSFEKAEQAPNSDETQS